MEDFRFKKVQVEKVNDIKLSEEDTYTMLVFGEKKCYVTRTIAEEGKYEWFVEFYDRNTNTSNGSWCKTIVGVTRKVRKFFNEK